MNLDENVRTMLRDRAESVAATPVVPDRTMRRVQMKKALSAGVLGIVAAVAVAGAFAVTSAFSDDSDPVRPAGTPDAAETTSVPTPADTPRDIDPVADFAPLQTGVYFIDPDGDPSTPLRVTYDIADEGWKEWGGAVKFSAEGTAEEGHVAVSITTVTNVVSHPCRDHSPADPPVGPSVDDLAAALADLAPFKVTSQPAEITKYGYRGVHLELTVPDLPVDRDSGGINFSKCGDGNLESWISPILGGFYGYTGPGYTEEFWILDVEGTRLMIAAGRSPDQPAQNDAELLAVLDSIQIEP